MVAFSNLPGIVALSIMLASTVGSAAPAPSPEKAVDNLNNGPAIDLPAIRLHAVEDMNSEEYIPIVSDLLGSLPIVGPLLGSLPIVGPLLVGSTGKHSGSLLGGLLGRQDGDDSGDGRDPQ